MRRRRAAGVAWNPCRVRLQTPQTESDTGTSTSTGRQRRQRSPGARTWSSMADVAACCAGAVSYEPGEPTMQRLAVLALCAFVALATVWLLARPHAASDGSVAEARSEPAGSVAPSPSGAQPQQPRESALGSPGSAGGFAAHTDMGSAATQSVRNGAPGPVAEAARSDAQPSAQQAAPGFEGRSPITPHDVQGWARASAQREPGAVAELESADASPSEADAHANEGGVLSAQEIAKRVNQLLPDGSLPPEQLGPARERERLRILERSRLAAALVQPRAQDPSPDASSQQPAGTLPQASAPARPSGSMPMMSGTSNGAAR